MMSDVLYSPYFGVVLSIFAFEIGVVINKRFPTPLANPMLIAVIIIIAILQIFHIPTEAYNQGGDLIALFLAPATAALAVPIYKNLQILKANLLPILVGTIVGSASSMGIILLLCKLCGFDASIEASLLAKSVTMPIALAVTEQLGGITPIIIPAVVFTGILGAILAPVLIKLFKITDPIAQGVGIGACSHALGTTRAVTLGEIQGAMSGIAMGLSGVITVLLSYLFQLLL